MKKILMIAFVLAVSGMLLAQNTVSKKVEKSYAVSGNGSLGIAGKYGDIHIDTWGESKVEVKVVIEVTKRTEKSAQEMLDQISIGIEDENREALSFRTNIDGFITNKSGDKLKIEYWVKAPKKLAFNINNSYGNFYIADNTGSNNFKIAYGNIKTDKCTGNTTLNVSYGNSDIEEIKSGSIELSYSNSSFDEIGNVTLTNNYSNIDAEKVGVLSMENRYGNLKVKSMQSLKGSSKYGNVTIGKLFKEIDFEFLHSGGIKVAWISKDFENIKIDAKYGSIGLQFEKGFGASIDADMTYCSLKFGDVPFNYTHLKEEAQHNMYKGVVGSKENAGNRIISINSSYGNGKIGYAD